MRHGSDSVRARCSSRRFGLMTLVTACMILALASLASGLEIPRAPTTRVNDYAGALSAGDRDKLEGLLAEGERATKAQMVVALFRSLQGEKLEEYTLRVANQWGIGRAGVNDGVVLFIFMDDRKMRLEVGKGLQSVITNSDAASILQNTVAPRMREGRIEAAIEDGISAVFSRMSAIASVEAKQARAESPQTLPTSEVPTTAPTTSLPPARMERTGLMNPRYPSCSGVKVTVPAGVDLTVDETARRYIEEGRQYVLKNCRRDNFSLWIEVMVYQEGDTSRVISHAGQGVHCFWQPSRPCGPFENGFKLAKQRQEEQLASEKKAQEEKLQAQQKTQQEEQGRKQTMLDQLRASQPGVPLGTRPTGVFFDVSPPTGECYNWVVIAPGGADLTDPATVQKLIGETKNYAYQRCRFRDFTGTVLKTQMYVVHQDFLPADMVPPSYGEWWTHSHYGTTLQIIVDCTRTAATADFQCKPTTNAFLRVKENFERRQALYKKWGFRDEREAGHARIRDVSMLTANPYPYQGKTVVIETNFHRMTAPTEAMFMSGSDIILVTNIPSDLFRQQGTPCIMAGRVVGTAEAALPIPMPGKMTVPKLSLIGAYICRVAGCEDFWIPSR